MQTLEQSILDRRMVSNVIRSVPAVGPPSCLRLLFVATTIPGGSFITGAWSIYRVAHTCTFCVSNGCETALKTKQSAEYGKLECVLAQLGNLPAINPQACTIFVKPARSWHASFLRSHFAYVAVPGFSFQEASTFT